MAYLVIKNNKKIQIIKYNSEEKKDNIIKNIKKDSAHIINTANNVEDICTFLTTEEITKIINEMFFNFNYIFENYIAESIQSIVEENTIKFMQENNKINIIYDFQPEYRKKDTYNIIKEDENYVIVDDGKFKALEYSSIKDFLNEYIIDGELTYTKMYTKKVFKPFKIKDALLQVVLNSIKEQTKEINIGDEFSKLLISSSLSTDTTIYLNTYNIDFQKYIITTDNFKNYVNNKSLDSIVQKILDSDYYKNDFYNIYRKECKIHGYEIENIEYVEGYNKYFTDLIFNAFKKIDVKKYITLSNFCPAKNNVQKKINRFEKDIKRLDNEKIALSERLISKRINTLREILINTTKYEMFCEKKKIPLQMFDKDIILKAIAKMEAIRYEYEEVAINLTDILEADSCVKDLLFKGLNYVVDYTYINEETKKNIINLIPASPEKEYPSAREMKRHFIIHYGPTNSGKTYESIECLKKAKSGIYLGPLRLLALEIQENLNNSNVPCSLLTGEEENIIDGALHMSSTVEKLNTEIKYDVCVIDECQMISDSERGFAWTKAILGVQADTIYLCMGPEALNLCIKLINMCGDTYETIEHHRRSELIIQEPISLNKKYIEKGDAYIVFSKKKVLAVAAELIKMGIKASMIYGNLPYSVRKKQVERFLNGDTDVIVSTNAIGMGMNLPVRRIVFLEDQKFNGKSKEYLQITDIKQIAGRAGRNKETGYVTSILDNNNFIKLGLKEETPETKKAYLGFSDEIIGIDASLSDILKVWKTIKTPNMFKRMDIDRFIILDEKLYVNVTKREKLKMITIAFDENNPYLFSLWKKYCFSYEKKEPINHPYLAGLELNNLEDYYQALELYYAFSRNFNYPIDLDWLYEEKKDISNKINDILVKKAVDFQKKCEICGRIMPWDSPYKTCKQCYYMDSF